MELEKIKEIVTYLKNQDYKELVIALMIYDKLDFMQDLPDLSKNDIEYLQKKYNDFINNDNLPSFLIDELRENKEE